ncbi:Trafficking protein particle complex subunit 10, TRAPPC10 domain containing protein [Amanita muscaria]
MTEGTQQQVLVTYEAPQTFLASGTWKQIHSSLLTQLPLRNIHWKSKSHSALRTIQELAVTLVPIDSVRDELTSQVPTTTLEKPLLNLYILPCEDTDLEAYRLVHKQPVKEWLSKIAARKHQDWLLLHLVKHDLRTSAGKLFQLKGSVLEKMKADFNTDKRDRVAQISWAPGSEGNAATWAEFINKIKDGLVHAFNSAIAQREEEVKRSESQRQMPGWNFCTFFILKESLSNSFEGMKLFDEALLHYSELEELFTHVLKEKNLSWFGTLINPEPLDDSSPLLALTKKPYRALILANNISVFDLRSYLLARRCGILAKQRKISEATRKVKSFLVTFARQLRQIEATLPRFFIESWIYNSALSAVDQCDQWVSIYKIDESQSISYHAAKGELLELCQIQLNMIGTRTNHLPQSLPFTTCPNQGDVKGDVTSASQQISNSDICSSVDDIEKFYDLYVKVTNQAVEMYGKAKRRKFALKLHESLAALDLHRGRFDAALAAYASLPAHYVPYTWSSLESFTLARTLDIYTKSQKTKDREWVHNALAFLKSVVEWPEVDSVIHEAGRIALISHSVRLLKDVSTELEADVVFTDHPALIVRIAGAVKLANSRDGFYLDVKVDNRLPCDIPIDEVTLVMSGRDSGSRALSSESKVKNIPTGQTILTLFCPVSSSGTYVLESSQVSIGHLKLQWSHRKSGQKNTRQTPNEVPIQVPPDSLALGVQIRQPRHIKLGHPAFLLVTISTGRNNTTRIALTLTSGGANFRVEEATVAEGQLIPAIVGDGLVFSDVPANTEITIRVPYGETSSLRVLKVLVCLNYTTTSEPDLPRILQTTHVVLTSLPFSVNVEDFFRDRSLISKFTISATDHQHVRIASVKLEAPENMPTFKVLRSPTFQNITTVRPTQPIHALFHLDPGDSPAREPLSLVVQYRMLREEVEELIQNSVEAVLGVSSIASTGCDGSAVIKKLVEALEIDGTWVELYELAGELVVPLRDDDRDDSVLESVRKSLERPQHSLQTGSTWRVMEIPVDVPQIHLVVSAHLSLEEGKHMNKETLYAGQPVAANLTICTSFHWHVDKRQQYAMRFDIDELVKDWLISGCKRGDFIARDGEAFSVSLTMIALHHGLLPLPKVSVTALPDASETRMGSCTIPSTDVYQVHGAERVLVLPRGGKSTFVVWMGTT